MKNVSILSTVLLICATLFTSQKAQAQWSQNATTKTITTINDFNIKPTAQVGIGTATPSIAKLEVQGAMDHTVASFRGSAAGKGVSIVSDWPGVYFNAYYNGLGKSMASGYAGIVNFDPDNGRFDFGVTGTAASVANSTITLTNRMCINKDGNVGIGTSIPLSKLDILAQDAMLAHGYEPFITLRDDNSKKSARMTSAHGDIGFFKGVDAGNGSYNFVNQMVIKDNGNIGIGTVVPESKLQITAQDGLMINGYQPFATLRDDNANKSSRIQSANGDMVFWKGVNSGLGSYNYTYQMAVKENGNVLIGTPEDHGYKLAVNGKIICTELKVQLKNAWPDYVFAHDYKLKPLEEVEQHIQLENHLPGIPAAAEMEKEGLEVGDMQKKMMEKIEELTLYLIEMNKENKALKQRVEQLEGKK